MIFAELHGKLGTDYSLAHERAEDLLTSTAFQPLRYFPDEYGFLALLRAVTPWKSPWLPFDDVDSVAVELWPRFKNCGCPDALLTLSRNGRQTHSIIVEVKLFSGKSSLAEGDLDDGKFDVPDEDSRD
ncbi:MAG: hypothetical protein ACREJC_11545, partial [Tepidisphaeraceae bacterium]